jgi:hypothetical protein
MKDLRQTDKDKIFEAANEKKLFIQDRNGRKHPAKLYGRCLDYPVISVRDPYGLHDQISWSAAQRLAEGTINTIRI